MPTKSNDYFMQKEIAGRYADKFARIYSISHALWRAFEAAKFKDYKFEYPMLDLGCGDGLFLKTYLDGQKPEGSIYGIDIDKRECERASKKGIYKEVFCVSGEKIPLLDSSVKMVFSNCVLEHITNLEETLGEVSRVTAPGGIFLFTALSDLSGENYLYSRIFRKLGLNFLARAYSKKINKVFKNYNCFSPERWGEELKNAGFEMIKIEPLIVSRTETIFDLFLPLSYLQQIYRKSLDTKIPFGNMNGKIVKYLTNKCYSAEACAERGANLLIFAKKI